MGSMWLRNELSLTFDLNLDTTRLVSRDKPGDWTCSHVAFRLVVELVNLVYICIFAVYGIHYVVLYSSIYNSRPYILSHYQLFLSSPYHQKSQYWLVLLFWLFASVVLCNTII